MGDVAITGVGLVTPLGCSAGEVFEGVLDGRSALRPSPFASACPQFAPVDGFDAAAWFPGNKSLRLMNRDAHLAIVAARLAVEDAGLVADATYPAEEIALYGATGLSGLPPAEIAGLVREAAAADGSLDLGRFGAVALRRIRPVLSFKILANMPLCFVSIAENLRGPNAVFTPWEGQGAQAIAAGMRAIADGDAPCAVVGGCDVKTHALSFLSLRQLGLFDSWTAHGRGLVPGEGAAFLVLEQHDEALRRGARVYALLGGCSLRSRTPDAALADVLAETLRGLGITSGKGKGDRHHLPERPGGCLAQMVPVTFSQLTFSQLVSAADGEPRYAEAEQAAIGAAGLRPSAVLRPKTCLGNLFAAAAAVQVALAALWAAQCPATPVVANCFGHGAEQAAFRLEAP